MSGAGILTFLGWVARWLAMVAAMVATGALLGACLFPLFGSLIGMDLAVAAMARAGLLDGGFYALIWAPGTCFVACLMWANRGRTR